MLDSLREANTISELYSTLKDIGGNKGDSQAFLDVLAKVIDDGFQQATKSASNIDITVPAGTLQFPFTSVFELPVTIGVECAKYWSMVTTTSGSPALLDVIVNVENDASKIAEAITRNLYSLTGATAQTTPLFNNYVEAIYKEVRSIIWTVTEINSAGTASTAGTTTVS